MRCKAFAIASTSTAVFSTPSDIRMVDCAIGHGATCTRDLEDNYSVWLALDELSQDVSHRLITTECKAQSVHLFVKDNTFACYEYVAPIHYPTQSAAIISQTAFEQFCLPERYAHRRKRPYSR